MVDALGGGEFTTRSGSQRAPSSRLFLSISLCFATNADGGKGQYLSPSPPQILPTG